MITAANIKLDATMYYAILSYIKSNCSFRSLNSVSYTPSYVYVIESLLLFNSV